MNLGYGYTGSSGYIISPNYDHCSGHVNAYCWWLIHAPENHVILFITQIIGESLSKFIFNF